MARDKITEYSSTASENTVVGDVNLAENSMNPSDVNNALREIMSHQKEAFGSGTPLYVDQTNNRVGIGGSPSTPLHVQASGQNANIRLQASDNGYASMLQLYANNVSGSSYNAIQSHVNGDGTVQWEISGAKASAEDQMLFHTGGAERMRIDSSGNVGIGTSSPARILHVEKDGLADLLLRDTSSYSVGTGPAVIFQGKDSGGTNTQFSAIYGISNGSNSGDLQFETRNSGSSAERVRIMSSGEVGIGETNPAQYFSSANQLVIRDGTANAGLTIRTGSSGAGTIAFADGATTASQQYNGYIEYTHGTNALAFATEATERMRLTSAGAMTMGTTSSLTDVSGITLKHDDAGAYPTMMFLQNQPGSGGTMGSQIHMGYAADYGSILRFYGNPFNSRPGGFQFRRVTGSGTSDLSLQIGTSGTLESLPTYNNTTGSGANVHISSAGGLLFRSTSSLRYKNTVNDATHGLTELLTLRPVTYKGNNDGDIVFGGLIAEEVHDAGLTEFVQYNEDNEPDALAYGNMVSLCIKAIQELKAENIALANRITTLEGA